jgi:hypothetical protein
MMHTPRLMPMWVTSDLLATGPAILLVIGENGESDSHIG